MIQHAVDGNIVGYKERFIARGFSWKEGIDYEETFAASRKTHDRRIMCANERRPCTSLEGTHGITHT